MYVLGFDVEASIPSPRPAWRVATVFNTASALLIVGALPSALDPPAPILVPYVEGETERWREGSRMGCRAESQLASPVRADVGLTGWDHSS